MFCFPSKETYWNGTRSCSGPPSFSHHKALVCALRSDERGQIRAAFTEVVLTPSTPPCWISVIDWMLQLIGLIWYITTSLETWSDDRQQIQLSCFNPKFMNLFSSPSSWISVSSLVRTICIYMIEVRERRRVRPSARITLYIISLFQCSHMWGLICFIISISRRHLAWYIISSVQKTQ